MSPSIDLDDFLESVQSITEKWARRNDIWLDCIHKNPLDHYNDEPRPDGPFLLLCGDGPALESLNWDDELACELRDELEPLGVFIELEDAVTACYHFEDPASPLRLAFDEHMRWQWTCRLVTADTYDVSGDLYAYFAARPHDFHRLTPRDFELLLGSVFAARGWRTELGPGSGDGGIDLRLWQSDPIGDLLTVVQVKRQGPKRAVRLEAVAALEAHMEREGANRGLFVTTSRYLPGVNRFAQERQHRLTLATGIDVQRWCEENAMAARRASLLATAPEALAKLTPVLTGTGPNPAVLVSGRSMPEFCVVIKESAHAALLARVPSRLVSGDVQLGHQVPVFDAGLAPERCYRRTVFRAQRRDLDGRISYWGDRELFYAWDGKPVLSAIWD